MGYDFDCRTDVLNNKNLITKVIRLKVADHEIIPQ